MKSILKVVITTVVITAITIYGGWVLSILWGWFIVPTFGLEQISVAMAVGLSIFCSVLRFKLPEEKEADDEGFTKKIIRLSIIPPIVYSFGLLLGYITTFFL